MITKEKYEQLRKEFGQKASWAVWIDEEKTIRNKYKDSVHDMSIFDDYELEKKLHNNFVIVGSHPSEDITEISKENESWVNFHAGSNDFKLRHAFIDTQFWGSYMTDFYSNQMVKSDEGLNHSDEKVNYAINELERELELLGGKPILIGLGRVAEDKLLKYFKKNGNYEIEYLTHHADYGNKETLREKALKIIEKYE